MALCARGMCIEEVCDARIGMCVHVKCSPDAQLVVDVVFSVLHQPWAFWLLSSLILLLWEPLTTATGLHATGHPVTNRH